MVGGLADWFAVTALFRRPLGLPIPHTALIPTRKAALGASLSDFVGENFLSVEVIRRRLEQADVVGRLGSWLSHPENAARLSGEAANLLKAALEVLRDDDIRAVIEDAVGRRVREAEMGPILGQLMGSLVRDGSHHALVDVVSTSTHTWLRDNRDLVVEVLHEQAPAWSPSFVDRALARRIHTELVRIAGEMQSDQQHPLRVALDRYLTGLADDLQHDPATVAKLQDLTGRLLDHAATRDAVGQIVSATRRAIVEMVEQPDSAIRLRTAGAIQQLGLRVTADQQLRVKVDAWVATAVEYVVTTYRGEITRTITDTIERWDGAEASRRIELAAGRDLQFIRVNGTVVGALAGLAIYGLGQFLG